MYIGHRQNVERSEEERWNWIIGKKMGDEMADEDREIKNKIVLSYG